MALKKNIVDSGVKHHKPSHPLSLVRVCGFFLVFFFLGGGVVVLVRVGMSAGFENLLIHIFEVRNTIRFHTLCSYLYHVSEICKRRPTVENVFNKGENWVTFFVLERSESL